MKKFFIWLIHKLGLYTKDDVEKQNEIIRNSDKKVIEYSQENERLIEENEKLKSHPYTVHEYSDRSVFLKSSITLNERENECYSKDDIIRAIAYQIYHSPEFTDSIRLVNSYNPVEMTHTYTGYLT